MVGAVAVDEAYRYAYENTLRASSRSAAGLQHPAFQYDVRGQGKIVLTRLAALRSRVGSGKSLPIDLASPYFAHLRLKVNSKSRDVMIGKRGFIDRGSNVQIVDWRNAPVSRIYYRYEEGDDYEEDIAGKTVDGVVEVPADLPGGSVLRGVVVRLLAPSASARYQSAREVRDALLAPSIGATGSPRSAALARGVRRARASRPAARSRWSRIRGAPPAASDSPTAAATAGGCCTACPWG